MKVLIGPPGAGKTRDALGHATGAAAGLRRVIVATLPPAWRYLTRRLARQGRAVLGVEVRHLQAVYTEILAHAGKLGKPFDHVDRLVTVARLLGSAGPGKARLFAGAIGEFKRFGLGPDFEPFDGFTEELRDVFKRYEDFKDRLGIQDLDDRRLLAIRVAREGTTIPFDTLVVDGLREVTPLEARFLRELAAGGVDVLLTLPAPAFGVDGKRLPPRSLEVRRYLLDNPVNEARFVLAEAARALEEGLHPAEVAVIVPEGLAPLYREIAANLGLPLTDELRRLTEVDPAAATLVEILELPDHPTPAALARIPGLEPLADRLAAWEAAGKEALRAALGEADEATRRRWEEVLGLLEREKVDETWVLEVARLAGGAEHEEALLRAGFRAIQAGDTGGRAREWWRHLIENLRVAAEGEGITLTAPERLAGRRYLRAFVAGATATRYDHRTSEDFFFPEEARAKIPDLPPRLRDQAARFFQEIAGCGEQTVITAHRTGTAGLEDPHPLLFPVEDPPWASGPRPARPGRVFDGEEEGVGVLQASGAGAVGGDHGLLAAAGDLLEEPRRLVAEPGGQVGDLRPGLLGEEEVLARAVVVAGGGGPGHEGAEVAAAGQPLGRGEGNPLALGGDPQVLDQVPPPLAGASAGVARLDRAEARPEQGLFVLGAARQAGHLQYPGLVHLLPLEQPQDLLPAAAGGLVGLAQGGPEGLLTGSLPGSQPVGQGLEAGDPGERRRGGVVRQLQDLDQGGGGGVHLG